MYDLICDPEFNRIMAEARAERREVIRSMFVRLTRRGKVFTGRVAAS